MNQQIEILMAAVMEHAEEVKQKIKREFEISMALEEETERETSAIEKIKEIADKNDILYVAWTTESVRANYNYEITEEEASLIIKESKEFLTNCLIERGWEILDYITHMRQEEKTHEE